AGPHAGDIHTPRLNFPVANLAQAHADIVFILVGLTVAFGFALRITGGTPPLWRRYWLFVASVLAQGVLGMGQYFLRVPDVLVILHVLGSVLVVAALASLWCASRDRGPRRTVEPKPAPETNPASATAS